MGSTEWARYCAKRRAAAEKAIAARDMDAALAALEWGPREAFVWPETYSKVLKSQMLKTYWDGERMGGAPILMRGAKFYMIERYGGKQLAIRAYERWISLFKVTEVSKSADEFFREHWPRFAKRFGADECSRSWWWPYLDGLRDAVLINGNLVTLDAQKIKQIEKSLKIIDKLKGVELAA